MLSSRSYHLYNGATDNSLSQLTSDLLKPYVSLSPISDVSTMMYSYVQQRFISNV